MSTAARERTALVETMRSAGPEQPTLCGEWSTRELAAHLVVRERRLDAAPGILIPKLADYTERVTQQYAAENDYAVLIDRVESGPPVFSPFKLLDPLINVTEMFIHHEDVRRAQKGWAARELDEDAVSALTRQVGFLPRLALAKVPARVSLRTPEGKTLVTVGHGAPVTVTGEPLELLLFASGRDEVHVELEGADDAIEAVRSGRGGL